MDKLKPCPFCGADALETKAMGDYWIICSKKCQIMADDFNPSPAKFAWNRRTNLEEGK